MHPEAEHRVAAVAVVLLRLQHALEDLCDVAQVEEVVRLVGGRQQLGRAPG